MRKRENPVAMKREPRKVNRTMALIWEGKCVHPIFTPLTYRIRPSTKAATPRRIRITESVWPGKYIIINDNRQKICDKKTKVRFQSEADRFRSASFESRRMKLENNRGKGFECYSPVAHYNRIGKSMTHRTEIYFIIQMQNIAFYISPLVAIVDKFSAAGKCVRC